MIHNRGYYEYDIGNYTDFIIGDTVYTTIPDDGSFGMGKYTVTFQPV